jgi:hypothetical protein
MQSVKSRQETLLTSMKEGFSKPITRLHQFEPENEREIHKLMKLWVTQDEPTQKSTMVAIMNLIDKSYEQLEQNPLQPEEISFEDKSYDEFQLRLTQAVKFASENNVKRANEILHGTVNDLDRILIIEKMAYAYAKAGSLDQANAMLNLLVATFRYVAAKANLVFIFASSGIKEARDEIDIFIENAISPQEKSIIYQKTVEGFVLSKQTVLANNILTNANESEKASVLYSMIKGFVKINDHENVCKLTTQTDVKIQLEKIILFTLVGHLESGNQVQINAFENNISADVFTKISKDLTYHLSAHQQIHLLSKLMIKVRPIFKMVYLCRSIQGFASVGNVAEVNKMLANSVNDKDIIALGHRALYTYAKNGYIHQAAQLMLVLKALITVTDYHHHFLLPFVEGLGASGSFNTRASAINTLSILFKEIEILSIAKMLDGTKSKYSFSITALSPYIIACKNLIRNKTVSTQMQAYTWISLSPEKKRLYLLLTTIADKGTLPLTAFHRLVSFLMPNHMNPVETKDFANKFSFYCNRDAFFKSYLNASGYSSSMRISQVEDSANANFKKVT